MYASQDKDEDDLSDTCLNALADAFSFNITYHKGSRCVKSNDKERVFSSPLVIRSDESNAYVMYTREETSLFAQDIGAKDNEVNEEVEKLTKKIKTIEEEKKELEKYKKATESLSTAFKEFINNAINFIKAVKKPNTKILDNEKKNLINAKVFLGNLDTEVCPDFANDLSTQKNNLKKEIEALKGRLAEGEENKGPEKERCYECDTSCEFYNGIKLKCKHTLDQSCLQEYS